MPARIFVVTGANKGIGYGIVESLAQKVESAIIYLTARDKTRGEEALASLDKSLGAKRKSEIVYHALEIDNEASVRTFADFLKKKHDGFDVLINNAGFAFHNDATESASVQAEVTIGINYYGTKLVSSHLVPLIRKGGRVVNVCSQAGVMCESQFMSGKYDQKHADKLHKARDEKDIDEFVEEYKRRAKDNTRAEGGFVESAYRVSKAAEIALTMVYHHRYPDLKINACCPGYVATDMSSNKGHLTIQEGADTPVFLAIDDNVSNGKFYYQRKEIEW